MLMSPMFLEYKHKTLYFSWKRNWIILRIIFCMGFGLQTETQRLDYPSLEPRYV